jgi:hypothetical protein
LVSRELDYRQEAQYLERFRENFSQVSEVVVPRDFPELTRRRVFVMEYLDGLKLDDPVALRQQGLDPVRLANIMIRAYLKQIAVDGFVQIDPHAGNFFADRQGRVIFLDFGMMAELPADDLGAVANLVSGILNRDGDQVVAAIDALGFVRPGTSRRLLKRAVRLMLDRLAGVELAPGPALDQAVADFQDFIYQEPLGFPARYMFLGRAIGMLFGLVSALYPDLDWMALLKAEALPLLAKRQSEGLPGWIRSLGDVTESVLGPAASLAVKTALAAGARTAVDLANTPGQLRRVLSLLEDGGLETVPELTPILRRLDRAYAMESAKLRLVWAGFFGAGAVTIHHFWPDAVWAVWLLGLAGLVALMASLAAQRRGRRLVRVRQAIPPFGDR